jgi:hypothetical protein
MDAFANHDLIVTYGENFGALDCRVPLNGLEGKYRKTRQPIDLNDWPMSYDANARYFTTIGNYRQTGNDVVYQGEVYRWSKHHEWEKYIDLPQRTSQLFQLALKMDHPADQKRLQSFGWRVVSPVELSLDVLNRYQQYFRESRAEFTVAKDQNVRLRSGWFSERDACYLATGKPVVAQNTGFSNILPTGEGLFAFESMDDVLTAIDEINTNYRKHCEAARAISEEYFAAEKVAARLLIDIGLG